MIRLKSHSWSVAAGGLVAGPRLPLQCSFQMEPRQPIVPILTVLQGRKSPSLPLRVALKGAHPFQAWVTLSETPYRKHISGTKKLFLPLAWTMETASYLVYVPCWPPHGQDNPAVQLPCHSSDEKVSVSPCSYQTLRTPHLESQASLLHAPQMLMVINCPRGLKFPHKPPLTPGPSGILSGLPSTNACSSTQSLLSSPVTESDFALFGTSLKFVMCPTVFLLFCIIPTCD